MKLLFTTIIAVLLPGCVTVGNKFDIAKADQLQPGISSDADAVRLLGPPTNQSESPSGTLLQWQYSRGSLAGGSGAHLAVLFDRKGQMVRVTHKSSLK
jgi:hypothetical protein